MGQIQHEITPDEDLVTPERLAKGDLEVAYNIRGKVSRAIPVNLTIIKEMIRRRVFPYHYEIYGVGFLELQAAFRAPWAIRRMQGCMEVLGGGLSNSQVDAMYENICRMLGKEKINVVQWVLEKDKKHENRSHHENYRVAFERLIEAMDIEKEKVYNSVMKQ